MKFTQYQTKLHHFQCSDYVLLCFRSIQVQPRCWETLVRWTFSPNCLLMWSPACELSLMEPWTSCSSCRSCSPVMQLSTHINHVVHLRKMVNVRLIICLTLESVMYEILNVGGMVSLLFSFILNWLAKTCRFSINPCVSAAAPTVVSAQEDFPEMGYFHKSMPSNTDIPPQKIAGASCLKMFMWHYVHEIFLFP